MYDKQWWLNTKIRNYLGVFYKIVHSQDLSLFDIISSNEITKFCLNKPDSYKLYIEKEREYRLSENLL